MSHLECAILRGMSCERHMCDVCARHVCDMAGALLLWRATRNGYVVCDAQWLYHEDCIVLGAARLCSHHLLPPLAPTTIAPTTYPSQRPVCAARCPKAFCNRVAAGACVGIHGCWCLCWYPWLLLLPPVTPRGWVDTQQDWDYQISIPSCSTRHRWSSPSCRSTPGACACHVVPCLTCVNCAPRGIDT